MSQADRDEIPPLLLTKCCWRAWHTVWALTMKPKVRQIYPHGHRQRWVTAGLELHRQSLSLWSLQNGGAEQGVLSRQTDRSEWEKGGGRGWVIDASFLFQSENSFSSLVTVTGGRKKPSYCNGFLFFWKQGAREMGILFPTLPGFFFVLSSLGLTVKFKANQECDHLLGRRPAIYPDSTAPTTSTSPCFSHLNGWRA